MISQERGKAPSHMPEIHCRKRHGTRLCSHSAVNQQFLLAKVSVCQCLAFLNKTRKKRFSPNR